MKFQQKLFSAFLCWLVFKAALERGRRAYKIEIEGK